MVRRLGPRLPLRDARARRPRVRQGAAAADDARVVHAPQRPAAGLRVELRRRQPAGARARGARRCSSSTAPATATGSSGSSTSCCSASPGGRTSRTRRATTCSAAAFSAWTTSGPFDRSAPLPDGLVLEQADGTGWMALYCLSMLEIAIVLAEDDPAYEDVAVKFFEHFTMIAEAINDHGLWDEADGFYYDQVRRPADGARVAGAGALDDRADPVLRGRDRRRSGDREAARVPRARERLPARAARVRAAPSTSAARTDHVTMLALVGDDRLPRMLERLGRRARVPLAARPARAVGRLPRPAVRVLAGRRHVDGDRRLRAGGVDDRPVRRQLQLARADLVPRQLPRASGRCAASPARCGDDVHRRVPARVRAAADAGARSATTCRSASSPSSCRDADGRRPVFGAGAPTPIPTWRDALLFHEYFHGDDGAGLGASHQTGWTGLVADLIIRLSQAREREAAR